MSDPPAWARLNFLVRPEVRERLERILTSTRARSLTQVLDRALVVYEHLLLHQKAGDSIVIRKSNGEECELVIIP